MKKMIFPISMAIIWGMVFASSLHDWVIGASMGIMMGGAFGLFGSSEEDNKEKYKK